MRYRVLGNTGLTVSEIGLGAEWLERHSAGEVKTVTDCYGTQGISIPDCWMPESKVRSNVGAAIAGKRGRWIIQGHFGSTWQDGQYVHTRDMDEVVPAFEDLLEWSGTGYIDLGMIHFVDEEAESHRIMEGEFLVYVKEQKAKGVIRHIGMSIHNPRVGILTALSGEIEMLLFGVNPAFDLLPATEDMEQYFSEGSYEMGLGGIHPDRAEFHRLCKQWDVGTTAMKGYTGGRLFSRSTSPFGVALTPAQCIYYALTRPVVASTLAGYDIPEHVLAAVAYETVSEEERDYASTPAGVPRHAYAGQCTYRGYHASCPKGIDIAMVNKLYDLAVMQPQVPQSVRAYYQALTARAEDCIACGNCEKQCPFGIPVIQRVKKVKELRLLQTVTTSSHGSTGLLLIAGIKKRFPARTAATAAPGREVFAL